MILRTTELTDNDGLRFSSDEIDTELIDRTTFPPTSTVPTSRGGSALDVDNDYVLAGAQYEPRLRLSMTEIAAQLDHPASSAAQSDRPARRRADPRPSTKASCTNPANRNLFEGRRKRPLEWWALR